MLRFLVLALTTLSFAGQASAAEDVRYKTDYDVTLAGLPVAKVSFVTEVARHNYTISGIFKVVGLVDFFTDISAETSVSGRFASDRLVAKRYSLVYKQGKSVKTYDVRYRNGNVVKTELVPAPGERPANWIPITPQDLRSVFDPISGLIISERDKLCPRTLPIFDGESRMDLVLAPKGSKTMKINNSEVPVLVCGVRYVPKSGFRKDRDDIAFMRQASDMEIWFAKTGTLKVYAPIYARVPTKVGPLHITAVSFGG